MTNAQHDIGGSGALPSALPSTALMFGWGRWPSSVLECVKKAFKFESQVHPTIGTDLHSSIAAPREPADDEQGSVTCSARALSCYPTLMNPPFICLPNIPIRHPPVFVVHQLNTVITNRYDALSNSLWGASYDIVMPHILNTFFLTRCHQSLVITSPLITTVPTFPRGLRMCCMYCIENCIIPISPEKNRI